MIALLSVAIVAGLFLESNQLVFKRPFPWKPYYGKSRTWDNTRIQCWTDWFNRDRPSVTGDWEILRALRKENPGRICKNPKDIEARTLSGLTAAQAGDVIHVSDTTTGFVCKIRDQPDRKCNDYRVRFSCHLPFCSLGVCWTRWFDHDNPSGTGDWEPLRLLRKLNPGKICKDPVYIEAATTYANTPALYTGETFYFYNPTQGFACRWRDQKNHRCRDYKVRFGCPCGQFQP